MRKVKVIQKENEKPIPVEVIADSVKTIADGIRKLRNGPLNDKGLMLLIQHAAPTVGYGRMVKLSEIRAVLDGIDSLERAYLKKKPA